MAEPVPGVPPTVRMQWRGKQRDAFLDTSLYLDLEGAIRSSKTTLSLWKEHSYALRYPGIRTLICRWTDDSTASLLKPLWREILRVAGTEYRYYPDEHRDEIICRDAAGVETGRSWVYLHGLRASEDTDRYAKIRGKTLARIYVDQAEELPEDIAEELKGRLSQKGYPHQLTLSPNPPGEDHWLVGMFPEDNSKADHRLIRLAMEDNAHNLDPSYLQAIDQAYPVGHPMRRRLIEGKRGLNVRGHPVYGSVFDRARMAHACGLVRELPVYEAWDFGFHHPCVVWAQLLPHGVWRWLGGLMGRELFIEDFAPLVLQYRAEWFPGASEYRSCCDPAGRSENSQGTKKNGVTVLADNGVYAVSTPSSNMPEVRAYAVETLAGYLRRGRFEIDDSRWVIVESQQASKSTFALDAFEAGYVWDERVRRSVGGKSIQVPSKDGYYEHVMNCGEYLVINFGGAKPSQVDEVKLERKALVAAQRDTQDRVRVVRHRGRGGY